eukprot:CAMPEP_0175120028 /NCGR_PEP_ID=MMETSP0087-20121206/394_1 /TAXON_ID=136419 /ORGANISM="Unknown Unknown, Strain D1" /LENGTH=279 /DNA_ID=CAMNT_0016401431 /DNA_START=1 /DNA_END=843 /DNA_ORIENTATION=-
MATLQLSLCTPPQHMLLRRISTSSKFDGYSSVAHFPALLQDTAHSTHIEVELWITANDACGPACDEIVSLKKELLRVLPKLNTITEKNGDHSIAVRPRFVYWKCGGKSLKCRDDPDCAFQGHFCVPDPDPGQGPFHGADIVAANVRESCVYKHFPSKWLAFSTLFNSMCPSSRNMYTQQCAMDVLKRVGLTMAQRGKVQRCFGNAAQDTTHPLAAEDMDKQVSMGVHVLPTLMLNGHRYMGSFQTNAIVTAICSIFGVGSSQHRQCIKVVPQHRFTWDV